MLRKPMTAGLMATALMMGPAFAQSSAPAQNASANAGKFVTQQTPNHWRASKLVGVVVYGTNNERIGDINEVLLDQNGSADAVVIGVGGFLGIGEKDVAVPYKSVEWKMAPDANRGSMASTNAGPAPTNSGPGTATTGTTTSTAGPSTTAGSSANTTGSTEGTAANRSADDMNRGYPDHAVLRMTKADLQNAPTFRYAGSTNTGATNANAPARTDSTAPGTANPPNATRQ